MDDTIATEPRGSAKLRKIIFGATLAALPAAIGGAVGLLTRSRRNGLIAGGITALGLGIARWQYERTFNDEPDYTVEERVGELEIRRYDARVEAETMIDVADTTTAIDRGFDILAKYIFGANDRKEKLGMTTPVTSKYVEGDTRVAFIMPITRTAASLPAPDDSRIEITEVPPRRVAVLAFRGRQREKLIEEKELELKQLVAKAGLSAKGEPVYAGFDPPWTLPLIRRNEVWIEVI
jgi:SOUL heme-binding protein